MFFKTNLAIVFTEILYEIKIQFSKRIVFRVIQEGHKSKFNKAKNELRSILYSLDTFGQLRPAHIRSPSKKEPLERSRLCFTLKPMIFDVFFPFSLEFYPRKKTNKFLLFLSKVAVIGLNCVHKRMTKIFCSHFNLFPLFVDARPRLFQSLFLSRKRKIQSLFNRFRKR
jgi:hypothetical protein